MHTKFCLWILLSIAYCGVAYPATSNTEITASKPELSTSSKMMWQLMVGRWYGSQPTIDGGSRDWVVERFVNGTYKTRFVFFKPDGSVEEQTEYGEWGISGGIYFSITKGRIENERLIPNDRTDPYHRNAYKIVELNDDEFVYESLSTGNHFSVIKVDEAFRISNPI